MARKRFVFESEEVWLIDVDSPRAPGTRTGPTGQFVIFRQPLPQPEEKFPGPHCNWLTPPNHVEGLEGSFQASDIIRLWA